MFKGLFPLFLLPALGLSPLQTIHMDDACKDQFVYETSLDETYSIITNVSESYKSADELRIYGKDYNDDGLLFKQVNSLGTASFTKIMISKDVETFTPDLTGKTVFYTGTEEEFNTFASNNSITKSNLSHILYQACDEGFMRFWEDNILPLASICDLLDNHTLYDQMMELYNQLSYTGDKAVIDEAHDESRDSTIKDTIEYISSMINPVPTPSKKSELSQSTMLIFVLVIASIGMTSIGVFYLLKDKKIIE